MTLLKKVLVVLLILGVISILFLTWYAAEHSMEEAMPLEVNDVSLKNHLLIATQGSEFKEKIVEKTVEQLKSFPIYMKVIDVGQLGSIDENDWSVIVILHTWEYSAPPKVVSSFVKKANRDKLIVLSTSGSGKEKIEGY